MLSKLLVLLLPATALLGLASAPAPPRPVVAPGALPVPADSLDALKIVYLGSSVPYGQGATNKYGYTSRYTTLLHQRHAANLGAAWTTANASVPGDNTGKVAARWRRDLLSQRGRYVVLALSLGNEGIHGGGQPIYDQFRRNLWALVERARADGRVPVVTNCYTRGDFTAEDYAFTRQMNLLLHRWDVPTVNLLGAVDDGQGRWVAGYWDDSYHPNDKGHAEMTRAIVPSLFDALRAGKPRPQQQPSAGQALGPATLRLTPEARVHAFTQTVSFQASRPGVLLTLPDSLGSGTVRLDAAGTITYTSPRGGHVTGATGAADARWHHLTLSHYYARGETIVYLDSTRVGSLPEKLLLRQVVLGGAAAPADSRFRQWCFYRAGMNADEVRALAADSLLQSSLELYAPLRPGSTANLAQSTNQLARVAAPAGRPVRRQPATAASKP